MEEMKMEEIRMDDDLEYDYAYEDPIKVYYISFSYVLYLSTLSSVRIIIIWFECDEHEA
jgi:hypothetical protein